MGFPESEGRKVAPNIDTLGGGGPRSRSFSGEMVAMFWMVEKSGSVGPRLDLVLRGSYPYSV
jgi:hypothetical protein